MRRTLPWKKGPFIICDTFASVQHETQIALKLMPKPPSLDYAVSFDKMDIPISPDQTKHLCDAVASAFPG